MGMVSWVLISLMIGIVVSLLAKARGPNRLGYVMLSTIGGVLGGLDVAYLYRSPGAMNAINLTGILVAGIGALMACAIWRLFGPSRKPAPDA